MKMIQVQKLTQEAFAPFGEVLTTEGREAGGNPASHLWYPQAVVIDGPTSINLMRVLPHDFILKDFEAHDHTTENLIAMDGEVIEAGKPITMVNLDSDAIERTITFTPTAVKPLLVPHILGGQLAIELPSIAEKKAYIAKQLTEETWESELRLECPHKHYVNMTPAVAECRARMYAELHGGKV